MCSRTQNCHSQDDYYLLKCFESSSQILLSGHCSVWRVRLTCKYKDVRVGVSNRFYSLTEEVCLFEQPAYFPRSLIMLCMGFVSSVHRWAQQSNVLACMPSIERKRALHLLRRVLCLLFSWAYSSLIYSSCQTLWGENVQSVSFPSQFARVSRLVLSQKIFALFKLAFRLKFFYVIKDSNASSHVPFRWILYPSYCHIRTLCHGIVSGVGSSCRRTYCKAIFSDALVGFWFYRGTSKLLGDCSSLSPASVCPGRFSTC